MIQSRRLLFLSTFIILTISAFGQTQENVRILWPAEYEWKIGSNEENDKRQITELVPGNESIDNWTIIVRMLAVKGAKNASMDGTMKFLFDQSKQSAITPTLTLIERNDTAKNPWIIFKIESRRFKDDNNPESLLYYILQGNSNLFSFQVAIKEKTLSKVFIDKWTKAFKSSELFYL
jgi:hypothetical protein